MIYDTGISPITLTAFGGLLTIALSKNFAFIHTSYLSMGRLEQALDSVSLPV